ncbi:hypothetical protein BC937DRAFT_89193, partial [Endogone sp. FLAS-F59071]
MDPNSTSANHTANFQKSYQTNGSFFAGPVTTGSFANLSTNNYVAAPLPISDKVFSTPEGRNSQFVERDDVFSILENLVK